MEMNFHPHIKNRSHRSENMYVAAGTHLTSSFVQPFQNASSGKANQAALILAYLVLEKNARLLAQSINKLYMCRYTVRPSISDWLSGKSATLPCVVAKRKTLSGRLLYLKGVREGRSKKGQQSNASILN